VGFSDRGELTEQVRAAQRMRRGGVVGAVVDAERVVYRGAPIAGQHPELLDRGAAAAFVQVVGGELLGPGDVQPLLAAGDVQAGLVHPDDRGQTDHRLDQLLHLGQRLRGAGNLGADPAGRGRRAGQVRDQQGGPLDRDVLEHHQIHRDRTQVRPVTDRTVHPARRGRGRDRAAAAGPLVQAVLHDADLDQRHVTNLTDDHPGRLGATQPGAAASARRRHMLEHLVRIRDKSQRRARRTRLLAGLARRAGPPLPLRLGETVRRRRQRGVARVLPQPPRQLSDLSREHLDAGSLLRDHPHLLGDHDKQLRTRQPLHLSHRAPSHRRLVLV